MTFETFTTKTRFVSCIICNRPTTQNHCDKLFEDIWVCYWCDKV